MTPGCFFEKLIRMYLTSGTWQNNEIDPNFSRRKAGTL